MSSMKGLVILFVIFLLGAGGAFVGYKLFLKKDATMMECVMKQSIDLKEGDNILTIEDKFRSIWVLDSAVEKIVREKQLDTVYGVDSKTAEKMVKERFKIRIRADEKGGHELVYSYRDESGERAKRILEALRDSVLSRRQKN